VEVGLPDEAGRAQIFHVHTRGFAKEGVLSADVDFLQLARLTPNFTGAEIEGVVKGGLSFALQRQISRGNDTGDANVDDNDLSSSPLNLCMLDLLRALKESKPHFGAASQQWATHQRMGFVAFRPEVPALVQSLLDILEQARQGGKLPLVTVLVQGPPGAGKSAVLAHLGSLANGFTFRRHLTGQELASLGEEAACDMLVQAVQDAHQCPHSLLMLDDLEGLSQYVPLQGGRVSLPRLHTLLSVLGRAPAKVSRVGVVLATTSLDEKTLRALGLWEKFSVRVALPLVETTGHVAALLGTQGKEIVLGKEEEGPWTVRELLQRQALNAQEEKKIEDEEGKHEKQ
jgi:vesicle-fusing ATPase